MNHPPPMPSAQRVKSRWFRAGTVRTPAQQASAMAFIVWRAAQQMLKRMRGADFDIDAGPAYFDFMRETLVFLVAVADRLAHAGLAAPDRSAFTVELVLRVAETLSGNETDLLGPAPAGAPYADRFIDLVNEVQAHYAEFGADPKAPADAGFEPDFAFYRYLGHRLEPTLPPKDRRWVLDQVMATEAPQAVRVVQGAMRDLFAAADETAAPARRQRLSGD